MAKYIPLDVVLAEIKRLHKEHSSKYECDEAALVLEDLEDFIDTIEVKEIDLEKELESWRHNHFHCRRDKEASGEYLERVSQLDLAKHCFELGLIAQKEE